MIILWVAISLFMVLVTIKQSINWRSRNTDEKMSILFNLGLLMLITILYIENISQSKMLIEIKKDILIGFEETIINLGKIIDNQSQILLNKITELHQESMNTFKVLSDQITFSLKDLQIRLYEILQEQTNFKIQIIEWMG